MLMRGEALMPTMMRRSANVVLQARFPHMRLDEGCMSSRAGSRGPIVELLSNGYNWMLRLVQV